MGSKNVRYDRSTWMGTTVPVDIRNNWNGAGSHYWRLGVMDALREIARDHDISEMVEREAAVERIDRERRRKS